MKVQGTHCANWKVCAWYYPGENSLENWGILKIQACDWIFNFFKSQRRWALGFSSSTSPLLDFKLKGSDQNTSKISLAYRLRETFWQLLCQKLWESLKLLNQHCVFATYFFLFVVNSAISSKIKSAWIHGRFIGEIPSCRVEWFVQGGGVHTMTRLLIWTWLTV